MRAAVLTAVLAGLAAPMALMATSDATPSTLYVGGANCSDSGSGTSSVPFCTIGQAAAVAVAGQTVLVASGTYNENVTPRNSGVAGSPIVYTAAPGATVIVTGQAHAFTVSSRQYITVTGFTARATTSNGIYVKGSSNITVSHNVVTQSGSRVSGQTAPGIYVGASTDSTISDNVSYDNSDAGIYLTGGSTRITVRHNETYLNARGYTRAAPGIDVRSPGNSIIGNISHDNEDSGIQFYPGGDDNLAADNVIYHNKGWSTTLNEVIGDHGIDDLGVRGNRIVSNSIYDNVTAGINVEGLPASWLAAGIGSADTTITVGTATGFPATTPFTIQIDAEQLVVTAGSGTTTWTVTRGANGTTPAAHAAGSSSAKNVLQWSGFVIENNVLMDNAVNCPNGSGGTTACPATKGNVRVDQTSFVGVVVDYDVTFLSVTGTWGTWRSSQYTSLASFQTASGQEHNAIAGNPRWASPSTGDLHLTRPSPAIDSADATASGEQPVDRDGVAPVDDPLTANTGQGVVPYVDRGAYEYQPDAPPTAALTVTPGSGTANLTVSADASASTDPDSTPVASYLFDFGDGTAATGPQASAQASHTYTGAGTFTVTLTVTDTAGLTGTATATVQVTSAATAPQAALTVSPASGVAPLAVTADASATQTPSGNPIVSYLFDFGDGSPTVTQSAPTATHTYAAGTWTAAVTVTDSAGLTSRATQSVSVAPPPTNLVANPGFESGTTGWNNNGRAGILLARVTGGHSGSYAGELTNTATTSQPDCTLNDSPNTVSSTTVGTYTASAWVRGNTGVTLIMKIREYNAGTFVAQSTVSIALTAGWTQVSLAYPARNSGSTLDLTLYTTNAAPGLCFDVDDIAEYSP